MGTRVWALLNLISLIVTIYLFLPLLHLKAKFNRGRWMKKVNEEEADTYDKLKQFRRRFRLGIVLELIVSVAALVAFILTEDMRLPMVLIDRWTPLMLLLLLICWIIDVLLVRYRRKQQEQEEAPETPEPPETPDSPAD